MQMLPEIQRNSRTGCYDSSGLLAHGSFRMGSPLVEAEKKNVNKVKSLKHIPLF